MPRLLHEPRDRAMIDPRGSGVVRLPPRPASALRRRLRVAVLVDPRSSGGTAGAVAAEIRALAPHVNLSVVAVRGGMFRGAPVNGVLAAVLEELGIPLLPEPAVVHADSIIL